MILLCVCQAARRLGVSVDTLRRWKLSGKLKHVLRTLGGHRRYAEHDVNALLNTQVTKQLNRLPESFDSE